MQMEDVAGSMLKIGILSGNWIQTENLSTEVPLLKKYGFDAVSININEMLLELDENEYTIIRLTEDEIVTRFRNLKLAIKDSDIIVSHAYYKMPDAYLEEDVSKDIYIKFLNKMLFICYFLECPFLVVSPLNVTDVQKEHHENISLYSRFIPTAKKYGVKICLENTIKRTRGYHKHIIQGACADISEAVWYIDTLNNAAEEEVFGFCIDIGYANVTARDIQRFIVMLGSRLKCVTVSDNNGIGDDQLIPYTQSLGQVEWNDVINGLREIKYEGTLSFRVSRAIDTFPKDIRLYVMKVIAAVGNCMKQSIKGEPIC